MKKSGLSLFFLLISFYSNISAQEYYNEIDLFLNSDESANAFRYNPAVLGLGHKFNANVNLFYDRNTEGINDIDILTALGNLGLAFNTDSYKYPQNSFASPLNKKVENTYSIGLGFGNKKVSTGISFDIVNTEYTYSGNVYNPGGYTTSTTNSRASVGILYRPFNKFSFSTVYKFNLAQSGNFTASTDFFALGIGFRPTGNSDYNIYADVYDYNLSNRFDTKDFDYKIGVDLKVIDGLNFTAFLGNDIFGGGFTFDFGHFGLRNSNAFYTNSSTSSNTNKYYGSLISLSYTMEDKENIIPKPDRNLEVNLSGSVLDYYKSPVLFGLLGGEKKSIHQVIEKIDEASNDSSIPGMLLYLDPFTTGGRLGVSATLEEIGASLTRFKSKNKKIVAYLSQGAGIEEYYIATFADKIVIPSETYLNYGLSIDVLNYKNFLQKFGIDLEVFSKGEYKLTFQGLLDSTSAEGDEVINRVLDVVYKEMLDRVKEGRNLSMSSELEKDLSGPLNSPELLDRKLVDKIGWYADAKDLLNEITNTNRIANIKYPNEWDNSWGIPPEIAVIGIYGGITTGESTAPPLLPLPFRIPFLTSGRTTGSQTILRQLENAFANKKIKAIILRVDSGGGSSLASAEISDAIKRLQKKYNKPFIVSMGDAAASGGYYVSTNADKIFAGNTTVTGSIGVYFAVPKIDSLMQDLKIKAQNYHRGENSDINSFYQQFSEEDITLIRRNIDYIYDQFISAVAEGREMTKEEVDAVARGRVWLGSDALARKLVDNIGGFYDALRYAKSRAKISNNDTYKIVYYPVARSTSVTEMMTGSLMETIGGDLMRFLGF